MGWYDKIWTRRAPITLLDPAGGATADFFVTIPKGFDDFWNLIDSAGAELRIVSYDSETKLTYYIDNGSGGAFDATAKANRTGRIKIDNAAVPNVAGAAVLAWLYWGPTSAQASGAGGGAAPGSGSDGHIDMSVPRVHRYSHHAQIPQQARPRFSLHKRADEETFINVIYSGVLSPRSRSGNGSPNYEEPYYATGTVVNTSGVAQSGMIDATRNRFFDAGNGVIGFRMCVKSGTTLNQYTALPDLRTILPAGSAVHQRLITSIGVFVRDTQHS